MSSVIAGTLFEKASRLRIAARTLSDSMKAGGFRSLYRGQGIEFSGVREYLRGDDVRAIDWNVTARMGRPYVKLFEEERDLQIFLIVDCSASMFTGAPVRTKYAAAAETAALLAVAAENNESPVGAVFFDGGIRFSCKPESGRDRTMLLLSKLDGADCRAGGSALAAALTGALKILKKRSLVFVISDFRAAGWEQPFALLSQKNDVAAVRITDSYDEALPEAGSVPFTDSETGVRMVLPTSSAALKAAWRESFRARTARWRDICARRGAAAVSIPAESEPVSALSQFFSAGERRR